MTAIPGPNSLDNLDNVHRDGMNINNDQQHLQKCLSVALEQRDLRQVKDLLERGLEPNFAMHEIGVSIDRPMIAAAMANFSSGLEALHAAGGEVDSLGLHKETPLIAAAVRGNIEAGRWLLEHGADASHKNSHNGNAIAFALAHKRFEFLKMVLSARPEFRDTLLVGAAKIAIRKHDMEVAEWLLRQGISPNLIDVHGRSWLGYVLSGRPTKQFEPLIDLLLTAGADVNLSDTSGMGPLYRAFCRGDAPIFLKLLQFAGDLDLPVKDGLTIRILMKEVDPGAQIRSVFEAWEASCKAHQIIVGSGNYGVTRQPERLK